MRCSPRAPCPPDSPRQSRTTRSAHSRPTRRSRRASPRTCSRDASRRLCGATRSGGGGVPEQARAAGMRQGAGARVVARARVLDMCRVGSGKVAAQQRAADGPRLTLRHECSFRAVSLRPPVRTRSVRVLCSVHRDVLPALRAADAAGRAPGLEGGPWPFPCGGIG